MNSATTAYQNIFRMLDKVGVPDSTAWRSLILYFRELKDYPHLSDTQKAQVQSLLASALEVKDYSPKRLDEILTEYMNILVDNHKTKIDLMLQEASGIITKFQGLLNTRYGNIEELENLTIKTVETEEDEAALIEKLHSAFEGVKQLLEKDIQSLENLATHDALTNIPNRRAFDNFIQRAIDDWKNNGKKLSLALFDIDFFKKFNDSHGHRIGDQVLQLVARYINQQVQPLLDAGSNAIAARYGGEEFALAISGEHCESLPEIVEKTRTAIKNFNFLIRDTNGDIVENGLRITVSAGIAPCWDGWRGAFVENLIDGADKALYYAKNQGRDKAAVFRPDKPGEFTIVPSLSAKKPSAR